MNSYIEQPASPLLEFYSGDSSPRRIFHEPDLVRRRGNSNAPIIIIDSDDEDIYPIHPINSDSEGELFVNEPPIDLGSDSEEEIDLVNRPTNQEIRQQMHNFGSPIVYDNGPREEEREPSPAPPAIPDEEETETVMWSNGCTICLSMISSDACLLTKCGHFYRNYPFLTIRRGLYFKIHLTVWW
jgi:hypothetical protein